MNQENSEELIQLTIDGSTVAVPKGATVYAAAKQLGVDIPVFCYQDQMPPFGACRVCLVEVEKMGKPQTSCTLVATEGMVVSTKSAMAVQSREEILEFLLINHPLDCPICDRGGECPLQEHALQHGPGKSRFFEDKRHFKKPLPLGPTLMLDRERCIICARCTRFGDLIAGDHALEFIERGYRTEVGTPGGRPVDSKFIGNTIMICPVGALTSQVYRFRARPWDNEPAKSSCTLCPIGCSLVLDSRDGQIMRTRSCENREVNSIWLCDKGWFGYEFTAHQERLREPLIRRRGRLVPATWEEALALIADQIESSKPSGKLAALGGNPLTVKENYLFQKLMREGAGVNHLDHRVGMPIFDLDAEGLSPGMEQTIGSCEELSFAVLLGLDLTEEFPVIWLRLRQAINRGAVVIFIGHFAPEIAPHLSETVLHAPGLELQTVRQLLPQWLEPAKKGKSALFVGKQYLQTAERRQILVELQRYQRTIPQLCLNVMEGRGNSTGARVAGMRPDLGPLGEKLYKPGFDAVQILERAALNGWEFLYVAGANPALKYPAKLWRSARQKLEFLVVQDLFLTETAEEADVVLPALSFVEKGGSFINIEGRVQNLQPGKEIPVGLLSDGEIFTQIAKKLALDLTVDASFAEQVSSGHFPLREKIELDGEASAAKSGTEEGLKATFAHALFDRGMRMQHNPHLSQQVKEPRVRIHPMEGEKRGIQDGEEVELSANGGRLAAVIQWDRQVAQGTLVIPLGFAEIHAQELGANVRNGLIINLRKRS